MDDNARRAAAQAALEAAKNNAVREGVLDAMTCGGNRAAYRRAVREQRRADAALRALSEQAED